MKEHRETGAVSIRVYFSYIKACFVPLAVTVLALFLIYHGLLVGVNVVLSQWSEASTNYLSSQALIQPNISSNVSSNTTVSALFDLFGNYFIICLLFAHFYKNDGSSIFKLFHFLLKDVECLVLLLILS